MPDAELSTIQRTLLLAMSDEDGLSAGDLASALNTDVSAVMFPLMSLRHRGYTHYISPELIGGRRDGRVNASGKAVGLWYLTETGAAWKEEHSASSA